MFNFKLASWKNLYGILDSEKRVCYKVVMYYNRTLWKHWKLGMMLDKTDQSADVSDNWNFVIFIVCDAIRRNSNISSKFRFMFFLFILRYCCADFSEIKLFEESFRMKLFFVCFFKFNFGRKKVKVFSVLDWVYSWISQ